MRVSITGSRSLTISFSDIESHIPDGITAIISGGASGIDSIASRFARARGIELVVIRPDYQSFSVSRIAPLARNTDIVFASDYFLFFWDGRSSGTRDTISKAVKSGKHGKVVVMGGVTCYARTHSVMSF